MRSLIGVIWPAIPLGRSRVSGRLTSSDGVAARRRFTGWAFRPGELPIAGQGRRQSAVDDLVEQRLLAHLEDPGRRGSIPVHLSEHVLERFTLGLSRRPAGDLP